MDAKVAVGGVAVLGAIAMVVILVIGLAGGTTTVEVDDGAFDADRIADVPLVVARHESGGFSIFGIQFDAPDRWLDVGVAPRPACLQADEQGVEILTGAGECADYAPLAGPVLGGGITTQGVRWVEVRVDVSRACFVAATVGEPWPPDGACRSQASDAGGGT